MCILRQTSITKTYVLRDFKTTHIHVQEQIFVEKYWN